MESTLACPSKSENTNDQEEFTSVNLPTTTTTTTINLENLQENINNEISNNVNELSSEPSNHHDENINENNIKVTNIDKSLLSTINAISDDDDDDNNISKSDDFSTINNTELKVIGVEISDEEIKQLKNDIHRLSPVSVSLHERTLGEILLTSETGGGGGNGDGCKDDGGDGVIENELNINNKNINSENIINNIDKFEINNYNNINDSNNENINDTKLICQQKELMLILSRVDDNKKTNQQIDDTEATTSEINVFNLSPKYMENDQLSRKSPMVVIDKMNHLNKQIITRKLNNEYDDNDGADNDVKIDNNLEKTNELNNEYIVNQESSSIMINETVVCDDNEQLIINNEDVTNVILTRLEAVQPEAFTEDSAESMTLTTGGAVDEVRSDGSDSGLGSELPGDQGPAPAQESDSETSFLDRIPDDILTDKEKVVNTLNTFDSPSSSNSTTVVTQQNYSSPQKSSLKRRLDDCLEGEPSAKRNNTDGEPFKKKRNIKFDAVTVYYFPRSQGFTCVPSQGGSTLGMSATHTHAERFSLSEHAAEQRRLHRARVAQLRSERAATSVIEAASSSEDPSDDTDDEPSDTEELDIDNYYFLQPVPPWQRRSLLRAAGVRRIDANEKDDCRDIRASREHCGCGCKGYCDPESCPCSRANVKCQVDRAGFPCGCSRDGCANNSGRIEFNPVRVRTHFIHTLLLLEIEKKQRNEEQRDATNEQDIQDINSRIPLHGDVIQQTVTDITTNEQNCMNTSSFTTLNYDNHETTTQSCQNIHTTRDNNSLDLYGIRDVCYQTDETIDNSNHKIHPEFNPTFQSFTPQQTTFSTTNYQDYQTYDTLPSTSSPSQFQPQFQNVNQSQDINNFTHYSYVQNDQNSIANNSCQSQLQEQQHQQQSSSSSSSQPQQAQPQQQQIYDNNFTQDDNNSQQYTNLNSVQQPMNNVVQQMGKLEPFSELLAGRYSYYSDVEPQPINNYHQNSNKVDDKIIESTNIQNNIDDCDENFGEIIKKSMVETVSA
ncbi:hypothetical protein HCN44_002123 [Aphidius gifuensis]|uniref:Cysteine/serine-rich nuclear protein N-terminal domain-containing protein n=1 Tax=Aphidius gifuensis TaxID=684658 RepID=A0A834Y0S3_APHGI|nr:protein PF14_0175 [Aphidius gifuensis]XP_044001136.1 protein PF14_0175 [Aphidius gifuensis]KAF7996491.1 hypothetical protein HCN44_002123 [Aphidius gifuensis]